MNTKEAVSRVFLVLFVIFMIGLGVRAILGKPWVDLIGYAAGLAAGGYIVMGLHKKES